MTPDDPVKAAALAAYRAATGPASEAVDRAARAAGRPPTPDQAAAVGAALAEWTRVLADAGAAYEWAVGPARREEAERDRAAALKAEAPNLFADVTVADGRVAVGHHKV